MPHCDPCKHKDGPLACYAATRPRLCELIHVYGRTDYEALVDQLTLDPPPPPPPDESAPTVQQIVAIETCSVRESDCACLSKPAICRRDDPDGVEMMCVTAGPDGGPCPGVQ